MEGVFLSINWPITMLGNQIISRLDNLIVNYHQHQPSHFEKMCWSLEVCSCRLYTFNVISFKTSKTGQILQPIFVQAYSLRVIGTLCIFETDRLISTAIVTDCNENQIQSYSQISSLCQALVFYHTLKYRAPFCDFIYPCYLITF